MTIANSDVVREIHPNTGEVIKSSCITHGLQKYCSCSCESYVSVSDYWTEPFWTPMNVGVCVSGLLTAQSNVDKMYDWF